MKKKNGILILLLPRKKKDIEMKMNIIHSYKICDEIYNNKKKKENFELIHESI